MQLSFLVALAAAAHVAHAQPKMEALYARQDATASSVSGNQALPSTGPGTTSTGATTSTASLAPTPSVSSSSSSSSSTTTSTQPLSTTPTSSSTAGTPTTTPLPPLTTFPTPTSTPSATTSGVSTDVIIPIASTSIGNGVTTVYSYYSTHVVTEVVTESGSAVPAFVYSGTNSQGAATRYTSALVRNTATSYAETVITKTATGFNRAPSVVVETIVVLPTNAVAAAPVQAAPSPDTTLQINAGAGLPTTHWAALALGSLAAWAAAWSI